MADNAMSASNIGAADGGLQGWIEDIPSYRPSLSGHKKKSVSNEELDGLEHGPLVLQGPSTLA